jgi:hypothetical protein
MSKTLQPQQPEDPLEKAIKESGKQGLIVFAASTLLHYGLTPESDRNFENSMKFGARQGLKKFLQSFADSL